MKIWRKIDFLFQNWHEELDEMWSEHFNGLFLVKVYNAWAKKSAEELSFMTMESDAKYEKKLTCGLENDMRNSENFHQSIQKSQNWDFDRILLSKVENAWA